MPGLRPPKNQKKEPAPSLFAHHCSKCRRAMAPNSSGMCGSCMGNGGGGKGSSNSQNGPGRGR